MRSILRFTWKSFDVCVCFRLIRISLFFIIITWEIVQHGISRNRLFMEQSLYCTYYIYTHVFRSQWLSSQQLIYAWACVNFLQKNHFGWNSEIIWCTKQKCQAKRWNLIKFWWSGKSEARDKERETQRGKKEGVFKA